MTYKKEDSKKLSPKDYRALIKKQAFYLAELLSESPEYMRFVAARKRLEADDEQTDILHQLRQQQMAGRLAAMVSEEVYDDSEQVEEFYLAMAGNPLLSEYLFAEGRLFHLISSVEEVFTDKLELWHLPDETEEIGLNSLLN
jgi:cell fate (sporulation/competence/biofilm development) regulator YlbF (YheA/YmcA/DUF963 family)